MLKARIKLNNELLNEMSGDGLDPLLYEVANWCDQVMQIDGDDKLIIEVTVDNKQGECVCADI